MRRTLSVAALALVASACASTGAGGGASSGTRTGPADMYSTGGGTVQINLSDDTPVVPNEVGFPPDQVFRHLAEVYGDMGIALTAQDPSTRTVGNERFIFMRRLAGKPGSEWLRCGFSSTGLAVADTYRIQMYIRTTVEPGPQNTSRVITQLQAHGRTTEGTSNTPVRCLTTGNLEREIATRVTLKASGG